MNDDETNVIKLRILGKKPGSIGRAGRVAPHLGDNKTADALNNIRKIAASIDRSRHEDEDGKLLLKPREEDFCQYAVGGYSLAAAWRLAYDAEGDPKAEHRGWQFARRSHIALRINELLEERKNTQLDEAERIRSRIDTELERIIDTGTPAEKMRAIELLGKRPHVSAFEDRQRVLSINENSKSEDVEKVLVEKLSKLAK